jgi:NitT/TauT family transport system permease protein
MMRPTLGRRATARHGTKVEGAQHETKVAALAWRRSRYDPIMAETSGPAIAAAPSRVAPGAAALRGALTYVLSVLGFIAFWWALAVLRGDPRVLPAPPEVLATLAEEAASGRLWHHLSATLARVAAAFVLAMAAGTALGVWLGRSPRADRWLDPWVTIFLNLPALVVIVLCYLWIGLNETAAIAAVAINKTALVLVTMREGARALSPGLADMAQVFAMPPLARFRHVTLPQLAPFLAASARTGLAIIWKLVLVVEFLGRSSGVGFQIHMRFQLFEIAGVLAYALAFVAVMLAIELCLLRPLTRAASAWRARQDGQSQDGAPGEA